MYMTMTNVGCTSAEIKLQVDETVDETIYMHVDEPTCMAIVCISPELIHRTRCQCHHHQQKHMRVIFLHYW